MDHYTWTVLLPFAQGEAPPGGGYTWLLPMIAIGFLFYFLLIRPQQREQGKRRSMLDALKKNDRVVTIGGIYATVTNVQRESDEVTLRIDEATNTKIRVAVSAIARVLDDSTSADSVAKK